MPTETLILHFVAEPYKSKGNKYIYFDEKSLPFILGTNVKLPKELRIGDRVEIFYELYPVISSIKSLEYKKRPNRWFTCY